MSEQAVIDAIASYLEASPMSRFDRDAPVVKLHEPSFGAEEITAATLAMLKGRVTMGPFCLELEDRFAVSSGCASSILVNSGSSANLLALSVLTNSDFKKRLHPGDEVIVSALSWSTTVWPLVQRGLVPVIVDIDPKTLNIDTEAAAAAVGPRTRAIMPVHVYGNPCDMTALQNVCSDHDLILIEDCCEALGASYNGQPVGSFGVAGTFSLYFSHHITTLEGGIVVSGDEEFSELARIIRAHGWTRDMKAPGALRSEHDAIDAKFLFVNEGYNLRMSDPQAAFGLVQLEKLAGFVDRRRHIAALLTDSLKELRPFLAPQTEQIGARHSWFGFPVIQTPDAPISAMDARAALGQAGIETRPIICGNIAAQPAMAKFSHRVSGTLDHADHVMQNGYALPCHQSMDEEQAAYVADRVRAVFAASDRG